MIKYKIEKGNKALKDGTYPLYLRLTQNRKLKRISLGISVEGRNFNNKATMDSRNWIRVGHQASSTWNKIIFEKIIEAQELASNMKDQATNEKVAKALKMASNGTNVDSFLQYAEEYVERYNGKEYNTYRGKKSSLNRFKEFIKKQGIKELSFLDISLKLVRDYESFLSKSGNKHNTNEKELSRLRAIVRAATKDDKLPLEKDPFRKFTLQRRKTEKVRLTKEEINTLYNLDLPFNSVIWNVRNAYLFSFYCAGIRCGDLLQLSWKNIQEGRLCYQMNKTNHILHLKIPEKANDILKMYKERRQENDFIFPFFKKEIDYSDKWFLKKEISNKNALLNKYLKKIGKKANILKSISMHTSRHSFANLSCQKTKDVRAVSMILGHSNIRITQNYLDSFDTTAVDHVIDTMFD